MDSRVACPQCSKTFVSVARAKSHYLKQHQSHMPFQCERCNKGFSYKRSTLRHIMDQHKDCTNAKDLIIEVRSENDPSLESLSNMDFKVVLKKGNNNACQKPEEPHQQPVQSNAQSPLLAEDETEKSAKAAKPTAKPKKLLIDMKGAITALQEAMRKSPPKPDKDTEVTKAANAATEEANTATEEANAGTEEANTATEAPFPAKEAVKTSRKRSRGTKRARTVMNSGATKPKSSPKRAKEARVPEAPRDETPNLSCYLCDDQPYPTFESVDSLQEHTLASHDSYMCLVCQELFTSWHGLWYHSEHIHSIYYCRGESCEGKPPFKTFTDRIVHISDVHLPQELPHMEQLLAECVRQQQEVEQEVKKL